MQPNASSAWMTGNPSRYVVIATLACQQYFSISLVYAAVPVILRANGASLELIGLFGTVFFAFTINFIWAPVVDHYSFGRLGLRRSWILATQAGSAAAMGFLALLNPAADFHAVFAVGCALAALVATQRIATLGYIADALGAAERPFGTAVYGWGAAVGNAIGGAACLQLIAALGWRSALLGSAMLLLAFAAGVLAIPEPEQVQGQRQATRSCSAALRLMQYAKLWPVALVITPAVFGLAVAFAMVTPRLVDLGFAAAHIGLIGALANVSTFTIIGPLISAAVVRTTPRRGAILVCASLAVCFTLLSAVTGLVASAQGAVTALCLVFAALAIQHVALTTWFLSLAQPGEVAADVTFLSAMMSAAALAGFAASGFVATRFGYVATLVLAAAGYAATAILAACAPLRTSAQAARQEGEIA